MLPDYRRITWSASLGSNQLALGAAWHLFASSEDADLDRLSSWDLGLTLRPLRQLSIGAAWRNLGSPTRGAVELPDQLVFGARRAARSASGSPSASTGSSTPGRASATGG